MHEKNTFRKLRGDAEKALVNEKLKPFTKQTRRKSCLLDQGNLKGPFFFLVPQKKTMFEKQKSHKTRNS